MQSITVQSVRVYPIALPYRRPYRTAYGEETHKVAVIIEVQAAEGVTGWGEAAVELRPGYGAETVGTALHVLTNFLIPAVSGQSIASPHAIPALYRHVRGHNHTKAGLECALLDAWLRANDLSLVAWLAQYSGLKAAAVVPAGVVVGVQEHIEFTLAVIAQHIESGYRFIKLKVSPENDVRLLEAVRTRLPEIGLLVDANGAYTPADSPHLQTFDAFNLLMLEQPFHADDLYEHSRLQAVLRTPLALDESVCSLHDLKVAAHLKAGRILNLKAARVGGLCPALEIIAFARKDGIQLRVGGMLETGIGRAAALALAALEAFTIAPDLSATSRYFTQDLTAPFTLDSEGNLTVPSGPGIGVTPDRDALADFEKAWHDAAFYA